MQTDKYVRVYGGTKSLCFGSHFFLVMISFDQFWKPCRILARIIAVEQILNIFTKVKLM